MAIVVGLKRRRGLDGCVADDEPRFSGSVSAMDAHAFMSGHMTSDASSGECLAAYLNDEDFLGLLLCRRC
jgi:hypothetical protein